jgi:cysteine synthase A
MPAVAVNSMLELVGGTPLVRLRHLVDAKTTADIFCKCEQFNPGGSLKDRIALSMIETAEREGKIRPGKSVIVEPTSGNTGVGLAVVCAAKGYTLLKAYGAELHLTPAAEVMRGAVERAQAIVRDNPNAFMPQQFNNPANPEAHRRTTAPEILAQLGTRVPDAFVHGVGTGGTITGVGQVLRAKHPHVRIVAVEPEKSAVLSGGKPGEHRIDGIGAGFVPQILDRSVITDIRAISEADAQRTKLELARREGLLVGISAGASVKVALDIARELGPGKTVVTVLCDTGERYFSSDAYFQ